MKVRLISLTATIFLGSCTKVPLQDIGAQFAISTAAWFEDEHTLFLFYQVNAKQGITNESVVEASFVTDGGEQQWVPVGKLNNVHEHVKINCGRNSLCGSGSPLVTQEPRQIKLRLRYHTDSELALENNPRVTIVNKGDDFSNRSLTNYGVFDALNKRVQWRSRHTIPGILNSEAERLGLRRYFKVEDERFGDFDQTYKAALHASNFYYYGVTKECPSNLTSLSSSTSTFSTTARAIWSGAELPDAANAVTAACAKITVKDGKGEYSTTAVARKNPEVRPAIGSLSTPIRDAEQLKVVVGPCQNGADKTHLDMQKQRLLISSNTVDVCTDDNGGLAAVTEKAAAHFKALADARRSTNSDMILSIAFHNNESEIPPRPLQTSLLAALEQTLNAESSKNSPRLAGAFVFDSVGTLPLPESLKRYVHWCPQLAFPASDDPNAPKITPEACAVMPDMQFRIGPFGFGVLEILPTKKSYLNFLKNNQPQQAGRMRNIRYLVPLKTSISQDVELGDYSKVTFFNNDKITVAEGESFSYCSTSGVESVFFRTQLVPAPQPIYSLSEKHLTAPEKEYELGLFWTFPFLMRLEYEAALAGSFRIMGASVPFSISNPNTEVYGPGIWQRNDFPVGEALTLCNRYCDHPAFDSAGVYGVTQPWKTAYTSRCFKPKYPVPAPLESGFPDDLP